MNANNDNTTPRQLVGLKYEIGEGLPSVILKACGEQAVELLRQHNAVAGPPLVEDPQLARALFRLPIDAPIGSELFAVVAALLTHVYSIDALLEANTHA